MSVTKSKRPRYNSEIRRDKVRNKTRICIGDAFERWRRLKTEKNLNTDANVANFLLDSYYGPSTSTPSKRNLKKHHLTAPSLSSIVCASSETLSNREDLSPIEERLEDDERTMDASEVLEESLQNMSIQDAETQVMNEQEINDLMNSVIDWGDSEGVSNEEIEADDSEDEDYVPRICIRYRRLYKKNARRYMLYTRKTSKTYGYIPELQAMILQKRLAGKGMPRRRTLRPDDPRRYGPLPPVPAPTIEELLHTQVRRGLVSTFQTKDL